MGISGLRERRCPGLGGRSRSRRGGKARFISPILDGAAHLFDAANDVGTPEALVVFKVDDARNGTKCNSLAQYLSVLGY